MKFAPVLILAAAACLAVAHAQTPTPQASPAPARPMPAPTPPPPSLDAKSWVLMDYATGQILASERADERVEPASITKIMTSYVVSAEIAQGKIHRDDEVFISEHAWRGGGAVKDGTTSIKSLHSMLPIYDLITAMRIKY
jgi:D-alanyl-D-alanine carboxypeptidase (penicillin-binding protein 5/6)